MFNYFIIIYILVFVIGLFGIVSKKEKQSYIVLTVILTLFSMFRFDVGYDYFWYWIVGDKKLVNNLIVKNLYEDLEIGIKGIYSITRFLGNSQYFFIITAFITFYFIYKGLYRDTKSPVLAITFFIFLIAGFKQANELIMQYLAVAIIYFYTYLILEKKYFKYAVIVIIVAILFHKSAILALGFVFIPKIRLNSILIVALNFPIVLILQKYMINIVESFLPQYKYLFDYGVDKFKNTGNLKYQIAILCVYLLINNLRKLKSLQKYLNKFFKETKKDIFYFNLFFIGTLCSVDLQIIFPGDLSRRIGAYFIMYGFVTVGNLFSLFNKKYNEILKLIFISTIFLFNMRKVIKYQGIILDKKPYYENGSFIARPNSNGFKLCFGKKYKDMSPYLPGEIKFYK